MKNEYLYLLIGILAGALIGIFISTNAVNSSNTGMMKMMGMHTQNINNQLKNEGMMQMHEQMMGDSEMTMDGMVNELLGKTGDDFDKAFIEQMIVHHQGAIDMAELVKTKASHQEIKDLAKDIKTMQTKEIEMMRDWQQTWGY